LTNTLFKEISFLSSCESTNLVLNNIFKESVKKRNTIIVTNFQTKGVGQKGNFWESENKKNLLFSVGLVDIDLLAEKQFILSVIVSLSIIKLLKKYFPNEKIQIKWPNDIYIGDKKIAGILIENSLVGNKIKNTIIGIGLNVNQVKFNKDIPNPISMKQILGKEIDVRLLLDEFVIEFEKMYFSMQNGGEVALKSEYLDLLYKRSKRCNYIIKGKLQEAVILGIDSYGFLEMKLNNVVEIFDIKDVEYILDK